MTEHPIVYHTLTDVQPYSNQYSCDFSNLFEKYLPHNVIVAISNKEIVGFISYSFDHEEFASIPAPVNFRRVFIENFYVKPEWRNRGIGKTLIKKQQTVCYVRCIDVLLVEFVLNFSSVNAQTLGSFLVKNGFKCEKMGGLEFVTLHHINTLYQQFVGIRNLSR